MPGNGKEDIGDYTTKVVNALNTSMSNHRSLSIEYNALVQATVIKAGTYSDNCRRFMQTQERFDANTEEWEHHVEALQFQLNKAQLESDSLRTSYNEAYRKVISWQKRAEGSQQTADDVTGQLMRLQE